MLVASQYRGGIRRVPHGRYRGVHRHGAHRRASPSSSIMERKGALHLEGSAPHYVTTDRSRPSLARAQPGHHPPAKHQAPQHYGPAGTEPSRWRIFAHCPADACRPRRPWRKEALGSVHYIAPEQARGGHVDARADIYSLGVVLYEMITEGCPTRGIPRFPSPFSTLIPCPSIPGTSIRTFPRRWKKSR